MSAVDDDAIGPTGGSVPAVAAARDGRGAAPVATFVRDLHRYRALLTYQFLAELKSSHVNTLLGQLWWLLEPLLSVAIYVVVIGVIMKRGGENYATFVLCGILPWHWFARSAGGSANALVRSAGLIRALNFPRSVLVVTPMLTNGFYTLLAIALFGLLMPLIYQTPSWHIVLAPVVLACQGVFVLALGLLLAISNVFIRDVQKLLEPTLRAWYFLSPALYELHDVPEPMRRWLAVNPFAAYLPAMRDVLMHHRMPDWGLLAVWTILSLVLLYVALVVFYRLEPRVARTL